MQRDSTRPNMDTNPDEVGPFGATVIGPHIPTHRLVVGGHLVPHIELNTIRINGADDGSYNMTLDGRLAIVCTQEELDKWAWFLASAMAVAAGYCCFGEGSKPMNLFALKCTEIQR